jgi:natural product biosynthesis luciferase-like monooxygenase protein
MDFGVMFFAGDASGAGEQRYRLLLEASRFVDEAGFGSVWIPERHFHPFGGLFPNPAVVGAALAVHTRRVQIRAGSLISPLHDTIRIVEDFAVIDNLSGGRVGISFGSGWHIDDFVLAPESYADRQAVMYRQIDEVKRLWRGEPARRRNSHGQEVELRLFPPPVQPAVPIWVTSSGNERTFASAGALGANLLTHLLGQTLDQLAAKIRTYRVARAANGFDPAGGVVSLMLHTYLDRDLDRARETVRGPLREYLRSALSLEQMAVFGGGVISGGHHVAPHEISPAVVEDLLDLAFERYFGTAALLGTPESCERLLWKLQAAGVDDVACLIDFIPDTEAVLASLERLCGVHAAFNDAALRKVRDDVAATFLEEIEL